MCAKNVVTSMQYLYFLLDYQSDNLSIGNPNYEHVNSVMLMLVHTQICVCACVRTCVCACVCVRVHVMV